MARNVAKTANLYFVKTEAMIDSVALTTVGESSDSGAAANQLRNISLANRLDQLCKGLVSIKSSQVGASLSDEAGSIISDAIGAGQALLETDLLGPLFSAITKDLESVIKQIHYEDYSVAQAGSNDVGQEWCSPFLQTLKGRVHQIHQTVIARLTCKDASSVRILRMVGRLMDIFVRHACMIISLSEAGKMRLASDLTQLELALAPLGCNLAEVGQSYRSLRSLRQLLFQDTTAIKPGDAVISSMPVGSVLMHMFTRAPSEMTPPHTLRGWTLDAFSAWVDQSTDDEVVALVKWSLDEYAAQVTSRGEKQFDPIYPIMMRLCEA